MSLYIWSQQLTKYLSILYEVRWFSSTPLDQDPEFQCAFVNDESEWSPAGFPLSKFRAFFLRSCLPPVCSFKSTLIFKVSSAFCDHENSGFLKRIDSFPAWMMSSPYNALEALGKRVVAQKSLWFSSVCSGNVNYRKPFLKKRNRN